jgi:aminopeptidase YwaD
MAKNFVFYNPETHRRIVTALEQQQPAAIIAATDIDPGLAGGASPFPLIEDGDFDIPNSFTTVDEGTALASQSAIASIQIVRGESSRAEQPIALRASAKASPLLRPRRLEGRSPGDSTTRRVASLLGLWSCSPNTQGTREVVPLNGEDYYAATGQMHYLARNGGRWEMKCSVEC